MHSTTALPAGNNSPANIASHGAAKAPSPLAHATTAVPTMSGQSVGVMAARHRCIPSAQATVCLLIPASDNAPTAARRCYLDVAAARLYAHHILECAEVAERTNHPQTEREALDEAINFDALDRAVSDLVGLHP